MCSDFHKRFLNPNDDNISDDEKKDWVKYIKTNVTMLYHETESEPIAEFLNINENKTRFVISDYIRATMISDNPVDDESLSKEEIEKHKKNRDKILNIFSELSEYLYSKTYEEVWNLIKTKYDNFDENPDINRLKIIFCDKYIGTSTEGYEYDSEMKRLEYLKKMLESLANEIINESKIWNTYNAVYILLECKKRV